MRGSPPDPPGGDILSESSSIAAWRTVYHRFRNRSGRPREIRPDLHLVTSMVEPGAMAQDYGAERETACAELHDYGAKRWRKVIGSCDYGAERGERGAWYDYGAERITWTAYHKSRDRSGRPREIRYSTTLTPPLGSVPPESSSPISFFFAMYKLT